VGKDNITVDGIDQKPRLSCATRRGVKSVGDEATGSLSSSVVHDTKSSHQSFTPVQKSSPSSSQLAVATFHQDVDRSLGQQLDAKVPSEVLSRQTTATPGTASFDRRFHVPAMNQNMEKALASTLNTPPVTTVMSPDTLVVSRKSAGNGVDTCSDKIVTAIPSLEAGSVAGGTPPVNTFASGTQKYGEVLPKFWSS